jgi:hypothetical protein
VPDVPVVPDADGNDVRANPDLVAAAYAIFGHDAFLPTGVQ